MKKYENFCSNLAVLASAGKEDLDNEFILSGIINKFSLQFELTWKLLKELLKYVKDYDLIIVIGLLKKII